MRKTALITLIAFLLLLVGTPHAAYAQDIEPPEDEIIYWTQEWDGERYPGGRPKVPEDVLERMENVSIEQAWAVLRQHGYHHQFAGDWKMIHRDVPIVGRALTVQYMPARPDLKERMVDRGHEQGRIGGMNSWPIDMLEQGDVYVADAFGKIVDGTLIGDNLGTAIYANSGNGVVFDGSLRDLGGLKEIEGFNAFVRGWHPSFIMDMMVGGINVPIIIGSAHVMPGDVVLAKREGVLFIPAHLAEEVVQSAEITMLRDTFGHQRLQEGAYTSGQIDGEWTEEIKEDFYGWLEANMNDLSVPPEQVQEIIETRPI